MTADALLLALASSRTRVTRPRATADQVVDVLREEIVQGRLRSGMQLREEAVGTSLRVSRNTVREAFAVLVTERIVLREPHRGVFVVTPTRADVQDLYCTRQMIEPSALRSGAGWTPERVSGLRRVVARGVQARESDHVDSVVLANQRWHRAVVGFSGSERVEHLMAGVLAEMRLVFHLMDDPEGFHTPYLHRNDLITTMIENGDRDQAADALQGYLTDAAAQVLASFQPAEASTVTAEVAIHPVPARG